jgi:hypothetical protein
VWVFAKADDACLLSTSKTRSVAEYTMTAWSWAEKGHLGTLCLSCRLGLLSVSLPLRVAEYTLATIRRVVEVEWGHCDGSPGDDG